MSMTPRQLSAAAYYYQRRRKREMATMLALMQNANSGNVKAVKERLRELLKDSQ